MELELGFVKYIVTIHDAQLGLAGLPADLENLEKIFWLV